MSRHHRENKRGWSRIRAIAIAKAGRRCEVCHRAGKLEVYHPIQLSKGGTHGQKLEVVCRNCHLARHHKTDPARAAWVTFLRDFAPC